MQSAPVVRRHTGSADWTAIVRLYDALMQLTGSPVVAVNRAVALAEAGELDEGLAILYALASRAFAQAVGLEADPAVQRFLLGRRQELLGPAFRAERRAAPSRPA